jgi:uncharacterized protein (DUF779 family)
MIVGLPEICRRSVAQCWGVSAWERWKRPGLVIDVCNGADGSMSYIAHKHEGPLALREAEARRATTTWALLRPHCHP